MLITRKHAHNKVISELHDSMNFWNLQICSKNSDFERENSTLQYCPHFKIAPHWDRDRTNPIWSWDSVGNFEWYLWRYALHFKISLTIQLNFQVKSLWRITLKCRETYWHDDKYGCHFAFFILYCRIAARTYFSSEDVHICLLLSSIVHHSAWSC